MTAPSPRMPWARRHSECRCCLSSCGNAHRFLSMHRVHDLATLGSGSRIHARARIHTPVCAVLRRMPRANFQATDRHRSSSHAGVLRCQACPKPLLGAPRAPGDARRAPRRAPLTGVGNSAKSRRSPHLRHFPHGRATRAPRCCNDKEPLCGRARPRRHAPLQHSAGVCTWKQQQRRPPTPALPSPLLLCALLNDDDEWFLIGKRQLRPTT